MTLMLVTQRATWPAQHGLPAMVEDVYICPKDHEWRRVLRYGDDYPAPGPESFECPTCLAEAPVPIFLTGRDLST